MTVKELMRALRDVDPDRMVYVPDRDCLEMLAAVVTMRHRNVLKGICIPDDVALLPASLIEERHDE